MPLEEKISDAQLLAMLKENNFSAWEALYKKYAAAMYGLICKLTDNKEIADAIMIDAFVELKTKNILAQVKHALCYSLLRFTNTFAVSALKKLGINPKIFTPPEETKLIHLLCLNHSLQEVSAILNIREEEVKKQLRVEILNIRNNKRAEDLKNAFEKQDVEVR